MEGTGMLHVLLVGFAIKHFLADFVLQTAWMVREKGVYGRPGGLVHAGWHAVLSLILLLACEVPAGLTLALVGAEWVIHYHIDYAKESFSRRIRKTPADHGFWITLGFDQMLHQLTYAAMIVAATGWA